MLQLHFHCRNVLKAESHHRGVLLHRCLEAWNRAVHKQRLQREKEEKEREYREKMAAFLSVVEAMSKGKKEEKEKEVGKEEEEKEMQILISQSKVPSQAIEGERKRLKGEPSSGNMWATARRQVVSGRK